LYLKEIQLPAPRRVVDVRKILPFVLLLVVLAPVRRPSAEAQAVPSNVIIIMADDMRWDLFPSPNALSESFPPNYAPNLRRFVSEGFVARNMFTVNSLCCPSRSSFLTGDYSHTHGVWNNTNSANGGERAFREHGNEASNLATWFDAAGYRTALVGKYLNNYATKSVGHIPSGWDRWVAFRQGNNIGYYDYRLNVNGTQVAYGSAAADYSTDVLGGYALDFVRTAPAPFFLYFTPYTPHSPWTIARRHVGMFKSYRPKLPPNVAEANVSDKPAWVRALAQKGGDWYNTKRKQMEMLMALDDAVGRLFAELEASGRLDETYVIFTSDNGLSGGSHRWTNKKSGWDEALRLPFAIRGPGIPAGGTSDDIILNIDVADTLEALTGVPVPATDGVSVADTLLGVDGAATHDAFVFERLGDATAPPSYCGTRTDRYKYIRYRTGEEELYDLAVDPWEMESRHDDPAYAAVKAELKAEARAVCTPPGYGW
jgi:arylsulfatase A-like enzyme